MQDYDFKLVYHTVATYLNVDDIPNLYENFIKETDFDCWRIYLFNMELARESNFGRKWDIKEKARRNKQIISVTVVY